MSSGEEQAFQKHKSSPNVCNRREELAFLENVSILGDGFSGTLAAAASVTYAQDFRLFAALLLL